MKTKYFLFLLLFLAISSTAQNLDKIPMAALDSLFKSYRKAGDFETALPYAEMLMKKSIAQFGKNDSTSAKKINDVGLCYYYLGDLEKALAFYEQAKDIRAKVLGKKHAQYSHSLVNLAMVYEDMGDYEKAEAFYKNALECDKIIHGEGSLFYANNLNNLAGLYLNIQDFDLAEPLMSEAMKIRKKELGDTNPDYASSLNNLALLYWNMNRYEAAEPLYKQALSIKEKEFGKSSQEYANSLNNLAVLYVDMKQYELAEPLYKEVVVVYENTIGVEHYDYAMALNNLAVLYVETQKYDLAESLYLKSLAVRKKTLGVHHVNYAATLHDLANLYKKMKRYKEAELLYLQAIPIIKKAMGESYADYIVSLIDLADLYIDMNNFEQANSYLKMSVLANSKANDPTLADKIYKLDQYEFHFEGGIVRSLRHFHKLGKTQYERTGHREHLKKGYVALETAMRINEQHRNNFNSEGDKLRTIHYMIELVDKAIATGLELVKYDDPKNAHLYLEKCFSFAEHNKSVLLADALKSQRAKSLGDLPDSLAIYESELLEQKDYLKKAASEAETEAEKEEIRVELNELNKATTDFVKSLKNKYPKYHALKYKNITATTVDIQKVLADHPSELGTGKTLLMEYFVSENKTYLFTVSKNDVQVFTIDISKKELQTKIQNLRMALSNYQFIVHQKEKARALYVETAYWFYKKLLSAALQRYSDVNQLIIIPDNELGHLPFEAFLMKPANQSDTYNSLHYLLRDYQISYNYSATLFVDAHQNQDKKSSNPNVSVGRAGKMLACAADYNSQIDTTVAALRGKYLLGLRKTLKPLPAAQNEVKSLATVFQGDFITGNAVTEDFFKKEAANYGIIHLAMHGVLHQRVPILSSLVFTENQDSTEDNFLQAFEIAHLKLNADLVVLSACETGYGKFEQGEGVLSLARSFMYAGVPSLVVSLWQVNDESTALIMKSFYQNLSKGMSKSAALCQAKLDYIQKTEGIVTHPAFWSAFVQIGDDRPIQIETKIEWVYWLFGGFLVLIVLFFLTRKR